MAQIVISAAHKSSGKTTVSIGLCRALHDRHHAIQPFKKGPDYIDPMWLGQASGRACYNLDFNTMGREEILEKLAAHTRDADIALIEGNKGLYDGLELDGSNSNAALAKLVTAPVILVIDARGMTRGIAPLLLGYAAFDPDIIIAGVILNQLGGRRHETKLRAVIEHYTDIPVLGAIQRNNELALVERHLGLIPSNETLAADQYIATVAERIADQVDLDRVLAIANRASLPSLPTAKEQIRRGPRVRIGIARDRAFGFYYPDDLEQFTSQGAELVFFDTLNDHDLPLIDGLFIGGGFPEMHMTELQANATLREQIRNAIAQGLPVYAECGGLMYLCSTLTWQGHTSQMVGAFAADTVMHDRPQGRGYIRLRERTDHPWPAKPYTGEAHTLAAHEFHYSSIEHLPPDTRFCYDVTRGTGIDGRHDGIVFHNVVGCYAHLRHTQMNPWVTRFLEFVRRVRASTH